MYRVYRDSIHLTLPPQAVTVQGPQGSVTYRLGFDQVGSLKAVASQEADGGLRDRFTGLVRFCHRDYDPTVGRFTAPDPLGDTGGDHDPYEYCVDDPVGRVDPEGLENEEAVKEAAQEVGFLKGMWGKVAALLDFGNAVKEQDAEDKKTDEAWDKAVQGVNNGSASEAMHILDNQSERISNSTVGGGGKVLKKGGKLWYELLPFNR